MGYDELTLRPKNSPGQKHDPLRAGIEFERRANETLGLSLHLKVSMEGYDVVAFSPNTVGDGPIQKVWAFRATAKNHVAPFQSNAWNRDHLKSLEVLSHRSSYSFLQLQYREDSGVGSKWRVALSLLSYVGI